LLTWISTSVVLGVLTEAISCMFIFYCFDLKFKREGINVGNIPKEMKELFDNAEGPSQNRHSNLPEHTEMQLMGNNQYGNQYGNNGRAVLGFPNQANNSQNWGNNNQGVIGFPNQANNNQNWGNNANNRNGVIGFPNQANSNQNWGNNNPNVYQNNIRMQN